MMTKNPFCARDVTRHIVNFCARIFGFKLPGLLHLIMAKGDDPNDRAARISSSASIMRVLSLEINLLVDPAR